MTLDGPERGDRVVVGEHLLERIEGAVHEAELLAEIEVAHVRFHGADKRTRAGIQRAFETIEHMARGVDADDGVCVPGEVQRYPPGTDGEL